jgi:hypothetical protein
VLALKGKNHNVHEFKGRYESSTIEIGEAALGCIVAASHVCICYTIFLLLESIKIGSVNNIVCPGEQKQTKAKKERV